ncbi:MAG TPA: CU044_5270 family protein [Streptosporangiaceae bacterium]|nr:CU044_5270 family protein [Streptosporangiaceae bacterium]
MNLDDMARRLPAERDLPAARKQILKEHLMTELRQADPGRGRTRAKPRPKLRRTVLVAGAVLTAAAVAIATAVVVGTSTSPPARHTAQPAQPAAPATAAQLLARIATAAARQPAPVVRDSDFTYIRSMVAYEVDSISNGHETTSMEKLHERQIWLPVANVCATGLLIEQGERTPISPFPVVNGKVDRHPPKGTPMPNFSCPSEGHLGDTTYRLLQSIPTQPDALLAYLTAGKKWTNDDPPTEIGDMIRETIMPPALAAALYRLAATLPGATLVPHATNVAGRAGIGIMWTSKTARQVYKNEWIFDKTTLQFIGERTYDPATGKLTGESAVIQQAFTAKAGQRP